MSNPSAADAVAKDQEIAAMTEISRCEDCPRLIGMDRVCCADCPPLNQAETTAAPPEGLPSSPGVPSFADQMQHAIDHGNVSARMEALQAQLAAAEEQIARLMGAVPCEVPPLDVTDIDWIRHGQWNQDRTYGPIIQLIVRERQLQSATEALAAERRLREKAEAVEQGRWQKAIYDLLVKVCGDSIDGGGCDSGDPLDFTMAEISQGLAIIQETAEAYNTRLRDALKQVYDYYMGPQACGDFTCSCNKPKVCGICEIREFTRAALAAVEGKGGM